MSERNLGADLAVVRKLLNAAAAAGYVGAGQVAVAELTGILDHWLAVDARTPLRFTTETADLVDTELGTVTGSQSRWVSGWWIDVPETMPLSPGVRHQMEDR